MSRRRRLIRLLDGDALERRVLLAAPHPLDLGSLDGVEGVRIDGLSVGDRLGFAVSGAGDVNGDGFDDIILGAPFADHSGLIDAGSSYVLFGSAQGIPLNLSLDSLDGSNGFRLDGKADEHHSGRAVGSAGDLNGDGIDDLIVGSNVASGGAGETYIVYGSTEFSSTFSLLNLDGTNGFMVRGEKVNDGSAVSVRQAGDVNSDGFSDIIIGAFGADPDGRNHAGASYVVFGAASGIPAEIHLSDLDGSMGFRIAGDAADDRQGLSVSGAGDVNGDGFADVIVGAASADPGGVQRAGQSYIVFGRDGGFPASIDPSALDGTNGFRINGVNEHDRTGNAVSRAGDVNGDGFDDVVIGSYGFDANGLVNTGANYIVFGSGDPFPPDFDLSSLNGSNGFRVDGILGGDATGFAVSDAGDFNGDGFDDLILGTPLAQRGAQFRAGESYLIFGSENAFGPVFDLTSLDGSQGIRLDGRDGGDYSGFFVRTAGDVNGDGFDDILIGADRADPDGRTHAGEVSLIYGGSGIENEEEPADDEMPGTVVASSGSTAVDLLIGGVGDDTLISDGGPDVLRGGQGNDLLVIPDVDFSRTRRLNGGNGIDTLQLVASGVSLDFTTIADNRISEIERIDITGTGSNTIILDHQEVVNFSTHSNSLTVVGDTDDIVLIGNGWTRLIDQHVGTETYQVYTQGAAVLYVLGARVGIAQPVVIDDGDPGFSTVEMWKTVANTDGRNEGVTHASPVSGSSVATWMFEDLQPGIYQISATWVAHANRATNAPFAILDGIGGSLLGAVNVNQQFFPDDFTSLGSNWENLITVEITGDTLVVNLSSSATGYVIADAIHIMQVAPAPAIIIDNGDAGFGTSNNWVSSTNSDAHWGDVMYAPPAGGSHTAMWVFDGLLPGNYKVSASWVAHFNRATDAPFTILDGVDGFVLANVNVNQQLPPDDFADSGSNWEDLITVEITGNSLVVNLSSSVTGYVIADAIRIEQVAPTPAIIIDNSDTGFATSSGWAVAENAKGYLGDVTYASAGSGARVATWVFDGLMPGLYRVSATWVPHANRATNASFSLFDGIAGLPVGVVDVNQQHSPDDFSSQGSHWEDLTTVEVLGDTLVVKLSTSATGYVIADAIRLQHLMSS